MVPLIIKRTRRKLSLEKSAGPAAVEPSPWKQNSAKRSSFNIRDDTGGVMVYKIVGKRDNETLRSERQSLLIAAAKARVWSSEGWEVVVTDSDGKILDIVELEKLIAAPEPKRAIA
jgi:hypothetical protein